MFVLKEITKWENLGYRDPNHTYLISGSKCVAYKKWHGGDPIFFSKPISFDRRYRKFTELKYNPNNWIQ